jgi:hypothetical protein
MMDLDFHYWKVPKLLKSIPKEVENIEKVIQKNLPQINNVFISLISIASNYPFITWLEYAQWIKKICILDEVNLPMATFDRMFIASNIEEEDLEDNPDRALCRYEFLEILVRMAYAKYGVCMRPLHQSLQILLDEFVFKHTTIYEWQTFRERELWNNREVNLTLEANL